MISFSLSIANPFKFKEFKTFWHRAWAVSHHRTLEIQTYRYAYNLFEVVLDLRWWGMSHAGPRFELGILGWYIEISLPSNHHWNRETHNWVNHD